jgi:hypothetical protein
MPSAADMGFSFQACINILADAAHSEGKAIMSIQNILDRNRAEVVTISPTDTVAYTAARSKFGATRAR